MINSKHIAGLIGPAIIVITISEIRNAHIWAGNTAAGVYLNGTLLFIAGLSIIRSHNHWMPGWPVIITLSGWFVMLLGLLRMFAPELQLEVAKNTTAVIAGAMFVLTIGIFLTFKAYSKKTHFTKE
ncbi:MULTISPECIES: hypothetical protein [Niastella]|uniref:Uncharacterized protein n=1 Tax=Niastella soli TaxID=2821487 RepID=A0ABS3YUG9_9BACT|nr:hypothetical protein [Niastella soli]MBO9201569.1 hypothetical protein [Niastella soli]